MHQVLVQRQVQSTSKQEWMKKSPCKAGLQNLTVMMGAMRCALLLAAWCIQTLALGVRGGVEEEPMVRLQVPAPTAYIAK